MTYPSKVERGSFLLGGACLLLVLCCSPTARAAPKKLGPTKKTPFGAALRTGSGFFAFHTTCVQLQAFYISDAFFSGLGAARTSDGMKFTKDGVTLSTFPEHLVVDVRATVFKCPVSDQMMPGYGEGFMSETSFQLNWSGSPGDLRPVSPLSTHERHRHPSLQWDYYFELPAKDVPLTDSLSIEISFRRGTAHTNLLANLGWGLDHRP